MAFKLPNDDSADVQFTPYGIPYVFRSGNETSGRTSSSIAVQIYPGSSWTRSEFGSSVAIGHYRIVAGAPLYDETYEYGRVRVSDMQGNALTDLASTAQASRFGDAVAVGNERIFVGAPYEGDGTNTRRGAVYCYTLDGNLKWKTFAPEASSDEFFGLRIAVGQHSGLVAVSAIGHSASYASGNDHGAVYLLRIRDGSVFKKLISPNDPTTGQRNFGRDIAMGHRRLVVGDPMKDQVGFGYASDGGAYIYDEGGHLLHTIKNGSGPTSSVTENEGLGSGVAIGGGRIVLGMPSYGGFSNQYGGYKVFDLEGREVYRWYLDGDNRRHGATGRVAIGNGRIVVSGASSNNGSMVMANLNGEIVDSITNLSSRFGYCCAIGDGKVAFGRPGDDTSGTNAGSVVVYNVPHIMTMFDARDKIAGFK